MDEIAPKLIILHFFIDTLFGGHLVNFPLAPEGKHSKEIGKIGCECHSACPFNLNLLPDNTRLCILLVSATMLWCSTKMKSCFRNWSDIRVFLAVLKAGSTLAASRELGMAQPTVARRIDALEHALGVALFERDTRGFHPTLAADQLVTFAETIDTSVTAFTNKARNLKQAGTGPIRMTASTLTFSTRFAKILADFSKEYPGTQFEFLTSDRVLDLIAGEADIAIRHGDQTDDDRLIRRQLSVASSSLYASPQYAQANGTPNSPDQLSGHSFIVFEGDNHPRSINDWLLARIDRSQIVTTCADISSMIATVQSGLGIGMVPTSMATDEMGLVRCFPSPEGTSTPTRLLISPQAYRRPEVKAFSTFFAPRYAAMFKRD
jgi:DNA-binding transcriptional LysR family regulator